MQANLPAAPSSVNEQLAKIVDERVSSMVDKIATIPPPPRDLPPVNIDADGNVQSNNAANAKQAQAPKAAKASTGSEKKNVKSTPNSSKSKVKSL